MESAEAAAHPDYVLVPRSAIEQLLSSFSPQQAPIDFDPDAMLEEFELACRVDYRLRPSTIVERVRHVKRLLRYLDKHPLQATRHDLRQFIVINPAQNAIKALRVLYGRFFESDLASCFRVPQSPPRMIIAPPREQLQNTYNHLHDLELEAAFLLLATSGLRRHELLELTWPQIDLARRIVIPPSRQTSQTKFQWVTCFTFEAKTALTELHLAKSPSPDERVFTIDKDLLTKKFKRASSGKITPQVLHDWFCCEMGRLGVPDRYVDAFCGRIPKRVLGRHYTDYSPERLKEIYDRAGLKVLEREREWR